MFIYAKQENLILQIYSAFIKGNIMEGKCWKVSPLEKNVDYIFFLKYNNFER